MQFYFEYAAKNANDSNAAFRIWNDLKQAPGLTPEESVQPYMKLFLLPGKEKRGMVIVLPGGGYTYQAEHEAEPVAKRFNELGYHACVLWYRVLPYRYPAPQEDALRTVRIVRANAEKWNVKPDKIAVLGFSSGGHLCASAGILFDRLAAKGNDACDEVSARPDTLILCYAVITAFPKEVSHRYSFQRLLNKENPTDEEMRPLSWDLQVREDTPPAFIWHTMEDTCVPFQNSVQFAVALRQKNVPCELHLFPFGHHGTGLGFALEPYFPAIAQWTGLCDKWLSTNGFK